MHMSVEELYADLCGASFQANADGNSVMDKSEVHNIEEIKNKMTQETVAEISCNPSILLQIKIITFS